MIGIEDNDTGSIDTDENYDFNKHYYGSWMMMMMMMVMVMMMMIMAIMVMVMIDDD